MDAEQIQALVTALKDARAEAAQEARDAAALSSSPPAPDGIPHTRGTADQIAKLVAALAEARQEFGAIEKNRTVEIRLKDGRKYTYRYAELHVILAAVELPLAKHGLILSMPYSGEPSKGGVASAMLMHSGGGVMFADCRLGGFGDVKEFGSSLSYLQRYMVKQLLCLATDSDSDDAPTRANESSAESKAQTGREARQERSAAKQSPPKKDAPKAKGEAVKAPPAEEEPPPPSDDDAPATEPASEPDTPEPEVELEEDEEGPQLGGPPTEETRAEVRKAARAYAQKHHQGKSQPDAMKAMLQEHMGTSDVQDIRSEGQYRIFLQKLTENL